MKQILQRFGALVCMGMGHQRGKRVLSYGNKTGYVQCPRCGATWARKIKQHAAKRGGKDSV